MAEVLQGGSFQTEGIPYFYGILIWQSSLEVFGRRLKRLDVSALILDVRLGLSKLTSQLELDEIAGVFCLHVTLLAHINGKALFLGI